MVEEEREKAAGKSRVARDSIDMTEIKAKESEMEALADLALADFAAAEGIVLESDGTAGDLGGGGDTTKSMGPAQTE